jgi:hypothetical protein
LAEHASSPTDFGWASGMHFAGKARGRGPIREETLEIVHFNSSVSTFTRLLFSFVSIVMCRIYRDLLMFIGVE